MASYTTPPIPIPSPDTRRAELVFSGVEQGGPSFEGRVFLNRTDADEQTPRTPEMGYAGSFHVYGYGPVAPPAIEAARQAGAPGPWAPIEKRIDADETVVRAAAHEADALTVTVVAVPVEPSDSMPARPFTHVGVVFDVHSDEEDHARDRNGSDLA
ncbi:MAG TPA: hypothetical protein VFX51_13885 [Solirubrobacteraceae bacterium]|nr:hypothetical protein [Solirubrobacteraceae bacterium]